MQKLQDLVEERKKLQILAEEKKEEKLRGAIRPKEIASALRKIQCGGHIEAPEEILGTITILNFHYFPSSEFAII